MTVLLEYGSKKLLPENALQKYLAVTRQPDYPLKVAIANKNIEKLAFRHSALNFSDHLIMLKKYSVI